jgi:hypothetical protein
MAATATICSTAAAAMTRCTAVGRDELFGEFGNDWLFGGDGGPDDGGAGNDRMDGGGA